MAKERSPAYSWYPKDALSSSRMAMMSAAEEGIYRRLLDRQWLDGSIPDDVGALKTLARVSLREMQGAWPKVSLCFAPLPSNPSRLVNDRLEEEREKQRQHSEERSLSGKRGAAARWKRERDQPAEGDGSVMATPSAEDGSAIKQPLAKDGSSSAIAFASASKSETSSPPPAEQRLTPQQERVKNIEVVYSAFPGSDPPDPGLIAKWLSTWEGDDGGLIRALSTMGEEGTLTMPPTYVTKCLATARRNGGEHGSKRKPPKRFTPAQAGLTEEHLATYRARGGGGE